MDLDNITADASQSSPYAVIVSNLAEKNTTVTVTSQDGPGMEPTQVAEQVVQPGQNAVIQLPQRHAEGSSVAWLGYRIKSTAPIIAYQFNPLSNVDVYSNDASLLLPANSLGKEYWIVSRPQFVGGGPDVELGASCPLLCDPLPRGECVNYDGADYCTMPYRSSFAVAAVKPNTKVTVRPSTATLAGEGVPAMQADQDYTFNLQPYQVLTVKSDTDLGDLTGTLVSANRSVVVFGGHESAHTGEACCTDHLEQQLLPTKTWGKDYIATKSMARGSESDYWRFIASDNHHRPNAVQQRRETLRMWAEPEPNRPEDKQCSTPAQVDHTQHLEAAVSLFVEFLNPAGSASGSPKSRARAQLARRTGRWSRCLYSGGFTTTTVESPEQWTNGVAATGALDLRLDHDLDACLGCNLAVVSSDNDRVGASGRGQERKTISDGRLSEFGTLWGRELVGQRDLIAIRILYAKNEDHRCPRKDRLVR